MCRGFGYGMGFNLGGGVGFPWMMLGMGILRVLVAVLVIYLIYKLVKGFTNSPNRPDKAMEILNERYVNGEINDEEYEKMKGRIK
ncbi:SHOCT domain-containing protein [Proteiniborus sp.]|uniref:SHOCT domain-containing protein n=1 Tax=Proteiniborus sp. TaxID=2079015 RepID=UPI00331A209B